MNNAGDLVSAMREITASTVDALKLCDVVLGRVVSVKPLRVQIGQRLTLERAQLILSRGVTDYETEVRTSWTTSTDAGPLPHAHTVSGGRVRVLNALQEGERVALLRLAGGQQFYILDRVAT